MDKSDPRYIAGIAHVQELVGSHPHEVVAVIHDKRTDQVVVQTTLNSFGYLAKEVEKDVPPELVDDLLNDGFGQNASQTHVLGIIDNGDTEGMILVPRPAAEHICEEMTPSCGD